MPLGEAQIQRYTDTLVGSFEALNEALEESIRAFEGAQKRSERIARGGGAGGGRGTGGGGAGQGGSRRGRGIRAPKFVNASVKAAQRFGEDTINKALATSIRTGTDISQSITSSALDIAAETPIFGGLFRGAADPKQRTLSRLAGLFGPTAAAGGRIDQKAFETVGFKILKQEKRRTMLEQRVERFGASQKFMERTMKDTFVGDLASAIADLTIQFENFASSVAGTLGGR